MGRTIDLQVVVYPALSRTPQPDPFFVLVGGPGQGAARLSSSMAWVFRAVREDRDLVFVDQRGTGDSNGLPCNSDTDDLQSVFDPDFSVGAMRDCLDGYDADLRFYTTPLAMDDLDEVRSGLGYDRINLWGGSYGTRAALVYLRRHGERVRSVVLDGAVPLTMTLPLSTPEDGQRAMDLLLDACEQEIPCRSRFPDLRRQASELMERLARSPARLVVKHPRTGEDAELELGREAIALMLFQALYSSEGASMLPLLIGQAYGGEFGGMLAMALAAEMVPENLRLNTGMFFSVICSEDAPLVDPADRRRRAAGTFLGESLAESWDGVCEFWPRGHLPANYRKRFRSDVPMLVLSGALDPVTPPSRGEEVVEDFPNARHVVLPSLAHGTTATLCAQELIADFVRDAGADGLDEACVSELQRPGFFVTHAGPPMAVTE